MSIGGSSHFSSLFAGGNLDNKRIGVGTSMYYPVEVEGGLLSMGDAHAAQGGKCMKLRLISVFAGID